MEKVEASGKTVDDALRAALAKLNASREEVEFVVLDEGQRGGFLFGRGGRDAVVSVERRPGGRGEQGTSAPPDTTIPRGGRGGGADRERSGRGRGGGSGGSGDRDRPTGGRAGRGLERAGPELTEQDFFGEGETPQRPPAGRRGGTARRSGGGRPAGASSGGGRPAGASAGAPSGPSRGGGERPRRRRDRDEDNVEPDINAEEVDLAAQIVDDLLQILNINGGIAIREPVTAGDGLGSARAVIDISGEDLGMLIGRRGESLMAFQYVVNLVMTRRYPGRGSVTVDVEHYRHRREEQVVSLAGRMAERVREMGEPITLEPMSAAERRLVHLALVEDPELETNSIGEGESRKVVISLMDE